MASIRIKSGTRAQLNAAAAASQLAAREPYFISDEGRFAVGTSASAYTAFAKEADVATTRVWASGMTVAQGERVISPLDWEEYRRTAATGGGSTDPADDLTNYIATSYRRTGAIVDRGFMLLGSNPSYYAFGVTRTASVVASGARTLMISAAGRGSLHFLGSCRELAKPGNFRLEVLVDGRTVFDVVGNPIGRSWTLIGSVSSNSFSGITYPDAVAILDSSPIEFRRSLEIYVTPSGTSLGSTDIFAYAIRGKN